VVISEIHGAEITVCWINRVFTRMTGLGADQVIGSTSLGLDHADVDRDLMQQASTAAIRGAEYHVLMLVKRRNGSHFWNDVHGAPVFGANGKPTHSIAIHTDITDRVEAEQGVKRARDQALQRLENFPSPVWRSHQDGGRFHFNQAWCSLTGRTLAQEIDGGWVDGIHPDDRERVLSSWSEAHRQSRPVAIEYRLRGADGSWRWVSDHGHQIVDIDGHHQGFQGVCTDLTERHHAEEALEWAHGHLAAIMDSLPLFLISESAEGQVDLWNRVAEQVFAIPAQDAMGRPLRDLALGLDWESIDALVQETRRDNSILCQDVLQRRGDGGESIIQLRLVHQQDSQANGRLWTGSDVSAQRVAERHQSQDQKLQSIGQLAAGIAHEINTPMQFVGDNTRFLSDAFSDLTTLVRTLRTAIDGLALAPQLAAALSEAERRADLAFMLEEVPKAIAQTLDGVERVTRIVKAMKEFSHPGAEELTVTDINHAIESTTIVSRNEWKYVADLRLDLDAGMPAIPVLPGAFNQVILNLVVNAAHAIADVVAGSGEKGLITISTRDQGDAALVMVTDTGTGIPESVRGRIFDPFFTTKEVGRGTGQGLAIARAEIIGKLGGSIDIRTATEGTERGTTFILTIPRNRHTTQVLRRAGT
jgi:PAS domain S-box-containing protein